MSATTDLHGLNHALNHVDVSARDLEAAEIDFPQVRCPMALITQDHPVNHVPNHVDLQPRDLGKFPQVRKSRAKSRRKSRTPLYVVEGA